MNSRTLNKVGDQLIVRIVPKQNGTTSIESCVISINRDYIILDGGKADTIIFSSNWDGGGADTEEFIRHIDCQDANPQSSDTANYSAEYRILTNDLFETDWLPIYTIIGKKVGTEDIIEIRITSLSTKQIILEKIVIKGKFVEDKNILPTIDNSIFSSVFYDEETEELALNLFKKLYFRGIVPLYIKRGDNLSVSEDEGYISLFYTIAKYFATILRFFKRMENFYDDEELMLEWIRQNGIYFDESGVSIEKLKYLSSHLYNEICRRGTKMIFRGEDDIINGVRSGIDGEFMRLIRCKKNKDEILYENIPLHKLGWCLGQSSPLYRGTCNSNNINKTREDSEDFQNLNNFQYFTQGGSSVALSNVDNRKVLKLTTSSASACGLGRMEGDVDTDVSNKMYVLDSGLDYEVTFMFKTTQSSPEIELDFGIEGFNNLKQKMSDAFITPNHSSVKDSFMSVTMNKFLADTWYFVRGIIHAYDSDTLSEEKLNIGFGNNLVFNNKFVKYGLPRIYIKSSIASTVYLWNYKIRPLVRGTNILPLRGVVENSHSLGFIQAPKIFYAYFRNNNNSNSEEEIREIIERYLLPFNVTEILQIIK